LGDAVTVSVFRGMELQQMTVVPAKLLRRADG
jgi:hypothetical protein